MMADESALQGQQSHLANESRGRSHILPYQPHGFTNSRHLKPPEHFQNSLPILRTLVRTLFPFKTHYKTFSGKPSENLLQSLSDDLLRVTCVVVRPLRRAPKF